MGREWMRRLGWHPTKSHLYQKVFQRGAEGLNLVMKSSRSTLKVKENPMVNINLSVFINIYVSNLIIYFRSFIERTIGLESFRLCSNICIPLRYKGVFSSNYRLLNTRHHTDKV